MVRGRTRAAEPEAVEDNGLNLKALKEKKISDLALIGKTFNIEGAANMRKQELIFAILQAQRRFGNAPRRIWFSARPRL